MVDPRATSFYCPFPSTLNPRVEEVQGHWIAWWARILGLNADDVAYRRLKVSQFCLLIGRCYPSASADDLRLIIDFDTYLFLWDDFADEGGIGADPALLRPLHEKALEVIHGAVPRDGSEPLLLALADIHQRMKQRMSAMWLRRFAYSLQCYFEATLWKARNRSLGVVADLGTYLRMRHYEGGIYPQFDMIEMAERIDLPLDIRTHPVLAELMRVTTNLITWSNDIFSLGKELIHGEAHNLVLLIEREQGVGRGEAVARATELFNSEVRRFVELERTLPRFGVEQDDAVARFVRGLRSWVRGNLDWSFVTGRYKPGMEATTRPSINEQAV